MPCYPWLRKPDSFAQDAGAFSEKIDVSYMQASKRSPFKGDHIGIQATGSTLTFIDNLKLSFLGCC